MRPPEFRRRCHRGSLILARIDQGAYQAYIASAEWAEKRRRAFAVHGTFCRSCGRNNVTLHVHHRTYERLGAEQLEDLVILCDTCHAGVHQLVAAGTPLAQATDAVIDSRPSAPDTRVTPDFVPLNRRPGYVTPHMGGRHGQLGGLPVVVTSSSPSRKR